MKALRNCLWFVLVSVLSLSHCAYHRGWQAERAHLSYYQPKSVRAFQYQVNQLIKLTNLQSAFLGIYIEEPRTRRILYAYNADKLLMPASNMKLITSAAALSLLKPDFRFKTGLYINGTICGDTLYGDVIVRASGDPTISGLYNDGDLLYVFREWCEALRQRGIKYVHGRLIGDDRIFKGGWGEGWSWDDLWYYYGAKTSALTFNDNCVDFFILPSSKIGEPARIWTNPPTSYLKIENLLQTVDTTGRKYYDFTRSIGTECMRIWGQIPVNSDTIRSSCAIENPTNYFLHVLRDALTVGGIQVDTIAAIGDLDDKYDYEKLELIKEHQSVSLSQIVKTLNKVSHNLYAEQLLRTLGYVFRQEGSAAAGIAVEREWLGSIGVDTNMVFIVDGSGLARTNLVTPLQIATVLRTMRFSPYWQPFRESLPIGGVDGTIKNRFKGTNAVGHVFAKTGYIGRVRALSGFVEARNGREYIFSIIANHYPTPTSLINELQDAIVTLLYNLEE